MATKMAAGQGEAARIEDAASALFAECLAAFHAFADLDQLAEDLRILSLNAELAAGRAGDKGRAVRALTQYTRALVSRLAAVQAEIFTIRQGTYANSAAALRELHDLALFERAMHAVHPRADAPPARAEAYHRLAHAHGATLSQVADSVQRMLEGVRVLSERTNQVLEVVSQSGSIATNIAVEAASAGQYEIEFRTVAQTMRRYVDILREITDTANAAVRSAIQTGEKLRRVMSRGQSRERRSAV